MSEEQVRGDSPLQMIGRTFVVTGMPDGVSVELEEVTPERMQLHPSQRRYTLRWQGDYMQFVGRIPPDLREFEVEKETVQEFARVMVTPYVVAEGQWKSVELEILFDVTGHPLIISADYDNLITVEKERLESVLKGRPA